MKTIKHTQGPWKACNNDNTSIWRVLGPQPKGLIAEVAGDSYETDCNARLIAAAPDMLEALKQVERYLGRSGEAYLLDRFGVYDAITKAEGHKNESI